MSTFLFREIVFGPVQSRRLGVSLGINLLPVQNKYCNFDCIYCECGRNVKETSAGSNVGAGLAPALASVQDIYKALEDKLNIMHQAGSFPDAITFAGNGEPTIHPAFGEIIDNTVLLRDRYAPQSKISVLSNATMLHRQEVIEALKKVDKPILKLDSAIDKTIELMNQPSKKILSSKLIEQLQSFGNQCIVQTMFLQGQYNSQTIDNTTPEELDAWERAIITIRPRQVMIYTIARTTPVDTLYKVSGETLREIAARIENHGIEVQISE